MGTVSTALSLRRRLCLKPGSLQSGSKLCSPASKGSLQGRRCSLRQGWVRIGVPCKGPFGAVDRAASTAVCAEQGRTHRLILLRHAESVEVTNPPLRDYDKPLVAEGVAHSARVAEELCTLGWVPEVVLSSDALRSKQTLDAMCNACDSLKDVAAHYYGSLYTMAALDGVCLPHLKSLVLSDVSESVSTVLCVGHNKGWEEAATTLCGQAVRLKNACAALLELRGVDWADVLSDEKDSQWKLVGVVGTKEA